MIRILTKKAFRFTKPLGEGSISKPKPNETPEEAAQRLARDAAQALHNLTSTKKQADHTFNVEPNVVTNCPDWIKLDDLFDWGVADGDIMELVTPHMAAVAAKGGASAVAAVKHAPLTAHHLAYLRSMGYPQENLKDAQNFFDRMSGEYQESFLAGAANWTPGQEETEEGLGPVDLSEEGSAALPASPEVQKALEDELEQAEDEELGPVDEDETNQEVNESGNLGGVEQPGVPGGPVRRQRVMGSSGKKSKGKGGKAGK